MNRIERLVWEETQLKGLESRQREPEGTTGSKLMSIAILVGLVALLASVVPIPPLDDAVVRALTPTSVFFTPAARPNPASEPGRSAATSSRDTADEVETAAPRDDPPTAASADGKGKIAGLGIRSQRR